MASVSVYARRCNIAIGECVTFSSTTRRRYLAAADEPNKHPGQHTQPREIVWAWRGRDYTYFKFATSRRPIYTTVTSSCVFAHVRSCDSNGTELAGFVSSGTHNARRRFANLYSRMRRWDNLCARWLTLPSIRWNESRDAFRQLEYARACAYELDLSFSLGFRIKSEIASRTK